MEQQLLSNKVPGPIALLCFFFAGGARALSSTLLDRLCFLKPAKFGNLWNYSQYLTNEIDL